MQNLSWPFQFPNYSHFQIFAESANHKRNTKSQFSSGTILKICNYRKVSKSFGIHLHKLETV